MLNATLGNLNLPCGMPNIDHDWFGLHFTQTHKPSCTDIYVIPVCHPPSCTILQLSLCLCSTALEISCALLCLLHSVHKISQVYSLLPSNCVFIPLNRVTHTARSSNPQDINPLHYRARKHWHILSVYLTEPKPTSL